jgi:hypothetical protein
MSELLMMEAALFQLRAVVSADSSLLPIRISADMLANAVNAAKDLGLNPARVNDIAFALNDLVAAVDDAGAPEEILGAMMMLQSDAAALRAANSLPRQVLDRMRELKVRMQERASAMDRAQYRVEGAPEAALPHPPEELRALAAPLLNDLIAAGFETPVLAEFVARPHELRYHTLNDIVDELEAIAAG